MKYRIVSLGWFYYPDLQGDRAPKVRDEVFDSIEAAQAEIDREENDVYYLSHNEAGRPELFIIDNMNAEYIVDGRNGDMSNYDWDDAECDCGECQICLTMMIDQDRDYCRANAVGGDK